MQSLSQDANHPSKSRSYSHRWNKNTGRNFATIRDDDESGSNDRCQQKGIDHLPLLRSSESLRGVSFDCYARADANTDSLAETVVVTATFALLEQYFQALCHIYPQKTIQIPNNGG